MVHLDQILCEAQHSKLYIEFQFTSRHSTLHDVKLNQDQLSYSGLHITNYAYYGLSSFITHLGSPMTFRFASWQLPDFTFVNIFT